MGQKRAIILSSGITLHIRTPRKQLEQSFLKIFIRKFYYLSIINGNHKNFILKKFETAVQCLFTHLVDILFHL